MVECKNGAIGSIEASPSFYDGYAIELIAEAISESTNTRQWTSVKGVEN